jgi:histidyl-tRNA synthetase
MTDQLQAPRGTQDVLPQEQKYWEYVVEAVKTTVRGFGFQRIDTPIFEDAALFVRGLGQDTDVVSKELFELKSRGAGSHYALRPEGTAPLVRSYIEHGMRSWPKPVKLFYVGPFFRYDRPQRGRWRQFHQFGMEVFGSAQPITDAQVIYINHVLLRELGLEEYVVRINSLGLPAERKDYLKLLKEHYRRNRAKMCKDCKERLVTNPLRVLDCKEEKCQQLANTAPRLLDHLSEESRKHFETVLKMLDELEVPYDITPSLVRGLDYYIHTVFEFVPTGGEEASQSSLIAGGRYNNLVKDLGGRDTAAVGAAGGIERLIDRLKEEGVELTITDAPQIFVAHLGDQAKRSALKVLRILQQAGIPFAESLDRDGMQAQLKLAERLGIGWIVIIGHKEVIDKTIILRSMESGMQEVIPQENMVAELKRRLGITLAD